MSVKFSQHEPLLTLDHVRAKRRDIADGERALAAVTKKLEEDRQQFQAMLVFVSDSLREQVLTESSEPEHDLFPAKPAASKPAVAKAREALAARSRTAKPIGLKLSGVLRAVRAPIPPVAKLSTRVNGSGSFVNYLTELLKHATGGLTHRAIKEEITHTKYSDRLENEAKAYHRTVSKLVTRGTVIRHGDRLYHRQVYDFLKKNSSLPVLDEGTILRENSAAHIAYEVLKRYPEGLSGPQLKTQVGAQPDAPKSVVEHGQYIYNVLATLIGSGRVVKDGGVYRVAQMERPRANGASVTNASALAR